METFTRPFTQIISVFSLFELPVVKYQHFKDRDVPGIPRMDLCLEDRRITLLMDSSLRNYDILVLDRISNKVIDGDYVG